MTKALEDAGTAGHNDLLDACKHLSERVNQDPWWTDTETKFASFPGWTKGQWTVPAVFGNLPDGPVNFLEATAKQLEELNKTCLQKHFPALDDVIKAYQKSDYEGVVKSVKLVQEVAGTVDKFLWIAPESVKATIEKTTTYSKFITEFAECLTDLERYRSAGCNNRASAGFVALKKAVGLVPVFGQFYQAALEMAPSLIGDFRNLVETHQTRMLNIANSN